MKVREFIASLEDYAADYGHDAIIKVGRYDSYLGHTNLSTPSLEWVWTDSEERKGFDEETDERNQVVIVIE